MIPQTIASRIRFLTLTASIQFFVASFLFYRVLNLSILMFTRQFVFINTTFSIRRVITLFAYEILLQLFATFCIHFCSILLLKKIIPKPFLILNKKSYRHKLFLSSQLFRPFSSKTTFLENSFAILKAILAFWTFLKCPFSKKVRQSWNRFFLKFLSIDIKFYIYIINISNSPLIYLFLRNYRTPSALDKRGFLSVWPCRGPGASLLIHKRHPVLGIYWQYLGNDG